MPVSMVVMVAMAIVLREIAVHILIRSYRLNLEIENVLL